MDEGITIRNMKIMYDAQIEAEIALWKIQSEKPYAQLTSKEKNNILWMDEIKYLPGTK